MEMNRLRTGHATARHCSPKRPGRDTPPSISAKSTPPLTWEAYRKITTRLPFRWLSRLFNLSDRVAWASSKYAVFMTRPPSSAISTAIPILTNCFRPALHKGRLIAAYAKYLLGSPLGGFRGSYEPLSPIVVFTKPLGWLAER